MNDRLCRQYRTRCQREFWMGRRRHSLCGCSRKKTRPTEARSKSPTIMRTSFVYHFPYQQCFLQRRFANFVSSLNDVHRLNRLSLIATVYGADAGTRLDAISKLDACDKTDRRIYLVVDAHASPADRRNGMTDVGRINFGNKT